MNNRNYRVIFSKAKNMLVVVSEATRSQGKSSNASVGGHSPSQVSVTDQTTDQVSGSVTIPYAKFASLSASILLGFGLASVGHAQIIADKQVSRNQQATVLKASNGIPQVDIQTPSKAGVSRNVFSQFDVTEKGAIINNSRQNTQTQMGGWVKANPWLSKGEARVIVNEVNSSNPSLLNGYTEIAGQKAELIIANPSGITCSGCGFINANRTALTTGVTKFDKGGSLTGFEVSQGKIRVDGNGMKDADSNYTQIISKTAELNAGVHAKKLDVVLGENSVSYEEGVENTQATGGNTSTGVALDISNLGGMYANSIRLVGTDRGMGVTNAGNINSTGTLTLDAKGNLINKGTINSKQQAELNTHTHNIENTGTIASRSSKLKVSSDSLDNSGVINSYDESALTQANAINNSGLISSGQLSLNANTLNNTGGIRQTGSGKLAIDTTDLTNTDNATIGQSLYDDQPATTTPTLDNAPSTASEGSQSTNTPTNTDGNSSSNTNTTSTLAPVTADGAIKVNTLNNSTSNAVIRGNSSLSIEAEKVSNQSKSSIVANQLTIKSVDNTSVINDNSRIQLDDINWQLQKFGNIQGQINSLENINISTEDSIDNTSGKLVAKKDIKLSGQNIDNTRGNISAGGKTSIDASNTLSNATGSLNSNEAMTINALNLENGNGDINSQSTLDISSGTLNSSGTIYSDEGTTINSNQLNNIGLISSQKDNEITTTNLTNTGTLAAGSDKTGKLVNNDANLTVIARQSMTGISGKHIATGKVKLTATNLNIANSTTQGKNVNLRSSTDLSTESASVKATETLTMSSDAAILNNKGKLSAKTLKLSASRLDNSEGEINQTGTNDLTLAMRAGINNAKGKVVSNSNNLNITTSDLNNQNGEISHHGTEKFSITTDSLNNQKGELLAQNEQNIKVSNKLNNKEGSIQSKQFDITTKTLDNTQGTVTASFIGATGTSSQLKVNGNIDNTKGNIISNTGALLITGQNITNAAGQLRSTNDNLTINSNKLTNTQKAFIYADKNTSITNKNGMTNQAVIAAKGNTNINTDTFTQGASGKLVAGMDDKGKLTEVGANISVTSTGKQINSGSNLATGKITLKGSELNLSNSTTSAQDLEMTATNGDINLDNAKTTIKKHAKMVATTELSNDKGTLQAESFEFDINSLSNVEGKINQQGKQDFNLTTKGNINNKKGEISVAGNKMTVSTESNLDNTDGKITHIGKDTATVNAKELNNAQGKILTDGALTSTVSNTLDNTKGEVQAKSVKLTANKVSNNDGRLVTTTGDMTLNTTEINNNGSKAKIQSSQALTINNTGSLTNQNKAIISAKTTANITSDKLKNAVGSTIASGKKLTLKTTDTLDNAGSIASTDAVLVNAKTLNNQVDAEINSNEAMMVNVTGAMSNAGDIVSLKNDVTVNTKTLDNQKNSNISGQKKVTINASVTLDNHGNISSRNDAVSVNTAQLNNHAEANIVAKESVDIESNTLNNQGDVISRGGALIVNTTDTLNNEKGFLSGTSVALNSKKDINNTQGLITQTDSKQMLAITAKDQLNNQNSSPSSNGKQLGVIANGNATINVGGLNNKSGLISAQNLDLKVITGNDISSSDVVNNKSGSITAKTNLTITAEESSELNNQGGKITADTATLTIGKVASNIGGISNNTAGSLIQANDLTISTGTIDNQNTKQAEKIDTKTQGIVATEKVTLNVATLNNQSGQVLSKNNTIINVSDSVNNTSGLLEASNNMQITDAAKKARLINAQGDIKANNLDIKAKSYDNNQGKITGFNTLKIDVADSITHDSNSHIKANDLTIKTAGNFTNNTELDAQNISLYANNITNNTNAKIVSKKTTELTAVNNITNYGLINGANTYLHGKTVDNVGGRIYGDHIAIQALELNNTVKIDGGLDTAGCSFKGAGSHCLTKWGSFDFLPGISVPQGHIGLEHSPIAPVIAARKRLDLGVRTLNNGANIVRKHSFNKDFNGQAQIISNGDMYIGGTLGTSLIIKGVNDGLELPRYEAFGRAGTIINKGATIQSVGNMRIDAEKVINSNSNFQTTKQNGKETSYHRYGNNGELSEKDVIIKTFSEIGLCGHVTSCNGRAAFYAHDRKAIDFDYQNGNGLDADGNFYYKHKKYEKGKMYPHPFFGAEVDGEVIKRSMIQREDGHFGGNYRDSILNETVVEDKVVTSDPSRIAAGGNITLNVAEVRNQNSQLISRGVGVTGNNVVNEQKQGQRVATIKGTRFLRTITDKGHIDKHDDEAVAVNDVKNYTFILPILDTNTTNTDVKLTDTQAAIVANINDALKQLKTLANAISEAKKTQKTTKNFSLHQLKSIDSSTLNALEAVDTSGLSDAQKQGLKALLNAGKSGKAINTAKLGSLIAQLNKTVDDFNQSVRTVGNATSLPNSSLYLIKPNSQAKYLVETDPSFTQHKNWLSSDYMLKQLQFDPAITQKRMGDGYYEQQLVRNQIMSLTGRRYLGNYQNEQVQYQGLMNAGVRIAKELELRPGIALTSAQMAQLTTDIVWMVEETITLADGSTQKVLVPKIYTRQAKNAIDGTGTLIAADEVTMKLKKDLTNNANLVAHKNMKLSVETLNNNEGGSIQGGVVRVSTKKNLNNIGGKIKAKNAMQLKVGGKLNNETTTYTATSKTSSSNGEASTTRTGIKQVGSIEVGNGWAGKTDKNGNPLTTLIIDAKDDINMKGGVVKNKGGSSFIRSREGDINLEAINVGYEKKSSSRSSSGSVFNRKTKTSQSFEKRSEDLGSSISGLGDVVMTAETIKGTAANINSQNGTTYMKAEKDIDFKEGRKVFIKEDYSSENSSGFQESEKSQFKYLDSDKAKNSRIGGKNVVMMAGNDVKMQGTDVGGGESTYIEAGNDVKITAATNTFYAGVSKTENKKNILSKSESSASTSIEKIGAAKSTIYGGTLTIKAGNDIKMKGIKAVSHKGTSFEAGNEVKLEAAEEYSKITNTQKETKTGFSMGDGASVFLGVKDSDKRNETGTLSHKGTVVSALDGNVTIKAKKYTQIGSRLRAKNDDFKEGEIDNSRGNIRIEAEQATVKDVVGFTSSTSNEVERQAGITAGVDSALLNNVITEAKEHLAKDDTTQDDMHTSVADYVDSTDSDLSSSLRQGVKDAKAQRKADKEKSTADWVSKGTGYAKQVAEVAQEVMDIKDSRGSVTVGYKQTNKRSESYDEKSTKSGFEADGNVEIIAKGAGKDSNINLQGVDFDVKRNLKLDSEHKVNWTERKLQSAKHTENDSFGVQAGVFAKANGAAGLTGKIEGSTEDSKVNKTSYTNSEVNIGNKLIINSGSDTNIKGVAVNANSAEGNIGGKLNIESLQEEVDHKYYKLGGSLGGDLDLTEGGTGSSVSGSIDARGIKSGFKGVKKRAGIFTGDGGFKFKVKEKTTLKGAAITTTEKAIKAGKNKFTSGGGIENKTLTNYKYKLGAGIKAGGTIGRDDTSVDDFGVGVTAGGAIGKSTSGISGVTGNKNLTTENQKTYDNRYTVGYEASGTDVLTGKGGRKNGGPITAYDPDEAQKDLDNQMQTTSNLFGAGKAAKGARDSYKAKKQEKQKQKTTKTAVAQKFKRFSGKDKVQLSDGTKKTASKMMSAVQDKAKSAVTKNRAMNNMKRVVNTKTQPNQQSIKTAKTVMATAKKKVAENKAKVAENKAKAAENRKKQQLLQGVKQLVNTTKPTSDSSNSSTDSALSDEF